MVAAEDERQQALLAHPLDLFGDPRARLENLLEKACALGAAGPRLGQRRRDVPAVLDLDVSTGEPVAQARVANRRRAHVDTATAGPQVEGRPDDRNTSRRHGRTLSAWHRPRCRRLDRSRPRVAASLRPGCARAAPARLAPARATPARPRETLADQPRVAALRPRDACSRAAARARADRQ